MSIKRKSQDDLEGHLPMRRQELHSMFGDSSDEDESSEEEVFDSKRAKVSNGGSPKSNSLNEPGTYSMAAMRMMSKMGHKEGKGLGKSSQGRVDPVALSNQRGRHGLGHVIAALHSKDVRFEAEREHVEINETKYWIPTSNYILPEPNPEEWILEGPRKETVDDETQFVDPHILKGVLNAKNIFDSLQPEEMRKARFRSNPFETINKAIFLNRAAVKMANMDAIFDFMFTSPKTVDGDLMVQPNELLYFADVCAGPGGFSEYVLWKKQWRAKGFGFTLKGKNDFKTDDFIQGPPECFEKHYGMDNDGDVFKEGNISEFTNFVMDSTHGQGVHFMMADGGFGVEGKENIQEILSKQLYLCQFIVALSIVRIGGHFVCKLFDLFTPFSVNLVYLMYKSFECVSIHKPNTSRPANSERYIICKWKKEDTSPVCEYLMSINRMLVEKKYGMDGTTPSRIDINEIVPRNIMFHETEFIEYIRKSNDMLGDWQIVALNKIAEFAKHRDRVEGRQRQIREECLKLWEVPNEVRKKPTMIFPKNVVSGAKLEATLSHSDTVLGSGRDLDVNIKSIHDWRCIFIGEASERTFFFGQGGYNVFYLSSRNNWQKLDQDNLRIEVPRGTLVYAEITKEIRGVKKSQKKVSAFHIIDAIFLGEEDVRDLSFEKRNEAIDLFIKSINKKTMHSHAVMRSKRVFPLENLGNHLNSLSLKTIKGGGPFHKLALSLYNKESDPFYIPQGILLFKVVRKNFMIARSKSNKNRQYWFNVLNKKSSYECPRNAVAGFEDSFGSRLYWPFAPGTKIIPEQAVEEDPGKLHGSVFMDFIERK